MIPLLLILTVLFSLQGFSQATEPSEHPLLDKYYPRAQVVDTNKAVGTQITSSSQTKPVSATSISTSPKRLVVTTVATDTTTRSAETIPSITTKPVITSTTAVNTPTTIARIVPVQKAPPSQPYVDTRLGSSTPQYDTWDKNANGAGAVTTSPK
jgi:hypothetical protein